MSEVTARAFCANHPDELAVATCDHCRKPVCGACRVRTVSTDADLCSEQCAEVYGFAMLEELLPGDDHPFRTGWKIWAQSVTTVMRRSVPLALLIALLTERMPDGAAAGDTLGAVVSIATVAMLGYGIALTGTILTQEYTGLVRGPSYRRALERLFTWVVTWILVMVAVLVGTLALIVPGIILGLRLFWADEFALTHRMGPIAALKESWRITEHQAGEVFLFQFLLGLVTWLIVLAGLLAVGGLTWALTSIAPDSLLLRMVAATIGAVVFFAGYAAIHAPELAKFYGMYASKALLYRGPLGSISLGLDRHRDTA